MIETLTALHDLPELLERIEQADRAALYQALGLTVRYRRVGSTEEVKLTSTLRSVDLEQVGGGDNSKYSQVPGLQGVDLRCRRTDWQLRSTPRHDGKWLVRASTDCLILKDNPARVRAGHHDSQLSD